MKKLLLSLSLMLGGAALAQPVYTYGFDGTSADMTTAGWTRTNQSSTAPLTPVLWNVASYAPVTVTPGPPPVTPLPFTDVATPAGQVSNPPNGQAGGVNSFAVVNFNSTSGVGTISNWLISPVITVENGDVVSFYTRIGKNNATAASYADNLELRMSPLGVATVNPIGGSADIGSFTNLLVEVNPALDLTTYPMSWATGYKSATISGLTGPTPVKFAFRYFVPNGGPSGANSDIIGIDTFLVNRTLSTSDFFKNNFAMYPNPSTSVLNIATTGAGINAATITDINGRVVGNQVFGGVDTATLNTGNLNAGVYFISVESTEGKGTAKFVKI